MTKILKKIVPYIFLFLILAAAVVYFSKNYQQFRDIKILSVWALLGVGAVCLLQLIPSALVFKKLLEIFRVKLGLMESIGLVLVTSMGNFLIPYVGGMGARAAYLKKRYDFPLSYFASTVGGAAILTLGINSLIGLFVVGYLYFSDGIFEGIIFFIFGGLLGASIVLIVFPFKKIRSKWWFFSKLNGVLEGWRIISRKPGDVIILGGYIFLTALCNIIIIYLSFLVISPVISLPDAIIVSSMTALSSLVNLTPAGLGISEIVIVFTSHTLGYMTVISISMALIWRFITSIIIFAGGAISSYLLSRAALSPASSRNSGSE
jgi:uncharacterized membrane protein YbhN (UPF0104 family)